MVHRFRSLAGLALAVCLLVPCGLHAEDAFAGVERVIAVGDVHGDYEQFLDVLLSAAVIDKDGNWTGGKTHLVQTGDFLDRGPDSRKVMDLLMKLEKEAKAAGGMVHVLLGNHEAMNVYGDMRYVSAGEYEAFREPNSEKAIQSLWREHLLNVQNNGPVVGGPRLDDAYRKKWEAEHPPGYAEHRKAFSSSGVYGRWLRGLNAVVKIDDTLFLHGGIGPKFATTGLRNMNNRIRGELNDHSRLQGGLAMDNEGPMWYRGLANGNETELDAHLDKVLKTHKVQRIAIGHTFTDGAVTPRFGGRVLLIDIGLARLYDKMLRQACLLVENGKPFALHRGKKLDLPADAGAEMLRYLKLASTLDPQPSSLTKRIGELQARVGGGQ